MKVILLHNAKAGSGEQPTADHLVEEIRRAGHDVTYQSTREKGSKWTLLEQPDLVIAAGGDGTVRKAALAVAGRGIPLAILPLGTANNLAKTFGLTAPVSQIIEGLATASRVRLDVALASGPWGKTPFIESAGTGLLARLISHLSRAPGASAPSVACGAEHLRNFLQSCPAHFWTAVIDDRKLSGNFLLMEAMNTRSVGPNLLLAPQSDPGDGLLDFVFLREEARDAFARYLQDGSKTAPPVEVVRGQNLRLYFEGPVHVDDFTWGDEDEQTDVSKGEAELEVHVPGEPIEVLIQR